MRTLEEARFEGIMNFLSEQYPDFDQSMGSVIVFASKLALKLDEVDTAWFLRRCEADELSRD